jgi:flagellar assembly protein FliH
MSDIAPSPANARKFTFDPVFDGGAQSGGGSSSYKRLYTAEEAEQMAARARAEGEAGALQRIEAETARALAAIADAARAALPTLAAAAHQHRAGSAELALACGRQIADAACERFPEAPLQAALAALAREIEATPKLILRVAPALKERLQAALTEAAESIGYPGQIIARDDPDMASAAFVLEWGDGSAAFDPVAGAHRIAETLESALAAEGLHAEALALDPSLPSPEEAP